MQEFFSSSGSVIPEIESELWLKTDKKGWKRHHFVLRGSGIYYSPKGKVKNSKDLICLAKFDVNQVSNPPFKHFSVPFLLKLATTS